MAKERRLEIEAACKVHIQQMNAYREQFETLMATYLAEEKEFFRVTFTGMQDALAVNDTQWVIDTGNEMIRHFGGEVTFTNQEEFDALMEDDDPLVI
jgi:hypothetical protein